MKKFEQARPHCKSGRGYHRAIKLLPRRILRHAANRDPENAPMKTPRFGYE